MNSGLLSIVFCLYERFQGLMTVWLRKCYFDRPYQCGSEEKDNAAKAFCLVDPHDQESKRVVEQTVGKTEAFCLVDTHYQESKSNDKSRVDKERAFCLADTRSQASDPTRQSMKFLMGHLVRTISFQKKISKIIFRSSRLVSRRRSV